MMLLQSAQSQAAFAAANDLLQECKSDSAAKYNTCGGHIMAISDYQTTLLNWSDLDEPFFCVPDGASTGQLVKVVTKYLNERPEKLHLSAGSAVANALYSAFPCS